MKVATICLAVVASVMASPFHHVVDGEVPLAPFDWSKIEPLNMFVEPVKPALFVAPGTRVIGGTPVPRNSVPYQCFIIINGNSWCGCSIIGRSMILSAAHCTMNARSVQVVLGAHVRTHSEATQVIWSVSGVINHPNYNQGVPLSNDISLLRISGQITLSYAIQIIGLASGNDTYVGSTGFLSGWGVNSAAGTQPPELHGVSLEIITNEECKRAVGDIVIASTICTSGHRGNAVVGGCNGDSGGPLVVGNVQVGVVSFGASRCDAGYPTGFARVSFFRTWISKNGDV